MKRTNSNRPERQPRWRDADDQLLVRRYHAGDTVAELCDALVRTPAALENRVLVLRRRGQLPGEAWQVLRRRGDLPQRSRPPRPPQAAGDTAQPAQPAEATGPERPASLWLRAMRGLRARNAAVQETHA